MGSFEHDSLVGACLYFAVLHVEVVVVSDVLSDRVELIFVHDALAVDYEVADLPVFEKSSAFHAGLLIATARTFVNIHFFVLFKAFVVVPAVFNELVEVRQDLRLFTPFLKLVPQLAECFATGCFGLLLNCDHQVRPFVFLSHPA